MTLIGENRDTTIIDGNGTGDVVQLGSNTNVTNFTIRNGEYGVKIWSYSLTPSYRGNTVNNSKIIDNLYGAISIRGCANNTITNNIIANNTLFGIHLWHAGNDTIINNTVANNRHGIDFYGNSNDNILRNNNMTDNEYNFGLILRDETSNFLVGTPSKPGIVNDVDTSNTVNGKPIIYWMNQHDQRVPTNAGYVMLINSTNIAIEGLNLSNNVQNIFLLGSNNTIIANNSVFNSVYGVDVNQYGWVDSDVGIYRRFCSFNTTVKGNTVVDNGVGIRNLCGSSAITNNTLHRNPLGILADYTNIISGNVVVGSELNMTYPKPELRIFYYPEWKWERSIELTMLEIGGIIVGGEYNVVYGNTVKDSYYGLVMFDQIRNLWGTENIVFHNNFINNTLFQAIGAPRGSNYYDNGYPSGGNFWSNYNGTDLKSGPLQNETGSDGIGDTAFLVFPGPQMVVLDHYPIMGPITIFDVGSWNGTDRQISIISNSTISNFQLNRTLKTIGFNVTGYTSLWFCRISIPNVIVQEFWQSNYTVLVNRHPVEFRSWTNESNIYIYFASENPKEVIIIPEFSQFTILLIIFTSTTLIATIVSRKKKKVECSEFLMAQHSCQY